MDGPIILLIISYLLLKENMLASYPQGSIDKMQSNVVKVFRKGQLYVTLDLWWDDSLMLRYYASPGAKDSKRNVVIFFEFFTMNHHLFKGIP
jgi:hypothetical protein